MRRVMLMCLLPVLVLAATVPSAQAIHWYRNNTSGCTPLDGATSDDPSGTTQNVTATVVVGHNAFETGVSGFSANGFVAPPQTHVKAGESVRWTWNSSHCHSVTSRTLPTPIFDSGLHYPTATPESPQVVPGFFEYPILDDSPTLSYTRTFPTPGTYAYFCVHHGSIGMSAVVVVEP